MALQADAVARRPQFRAVRVMAVAAGHALGEHLALAERAVFIDLVLDLAVRVIEAALEQRDEMRVGERPVRQPVLRQLGAARVAAPANLELGAGRQRRAALRRAARRVRDPSDAGPLVEGDGQTVVGRGNREKTPPIALSFGPGDVLRSGTVARLARHVDVGPCRPIPVARREVVLVQIRRVALGAHEVPVLIYARPMQDVVVADRLIGMKVEPALAASRALPRIPRDRQCLKAPTREGDQVLLKGIDAEGVGDLEIRHLSVMPLGVHEELSVTAEEARGDAIGNAGRIVEITEDRAVFGRLHGERVMRAAPRRDLPGMTAGTGGTAHIGAGFRWRRGGAAADLQVADHHRQDDQPCGEEQGGYEPASGTQARRRRAIDRLVLRFAYLSALLALAGGNRHGVSRAPFDRAVAAQRSRSMLAFELPGSLGKGRTAVRG